MIFWIDAQLSPSLALWLESKFDIRALALRDIGLRNANDREIFLAARRERATVITKDGDFVRLLEDLWPSASSDLDHLRQHLERQPQEDIGKHTPTSFRIFETGRGVNRSQLIRENKNGRDYLMKRGIKGCGCAVAVLVVVLGAAGYVGWKYALPWWKTKPPPASGGELQIHVLDVGPVNGDSILVISPTGKTVLIDAGDAGKGKAVLEALKRHNVQQIDYFIATHPHPDHIGGADEVLKATKTIIAIDNGQNPDVPESLLPAKPAAPKAGQKPAPKKTGRSTSVIKFFDEYKEAITNSGAQYEQAQAGNKYDLGGGAFLSILAPSEPLFTREQMKTGGNLPNANSIVVRLDYGEFSTLLAGDSEDQTEHRMLTKDLNLRVKVLKVGHHGSKYATTQDFVDRVKPEVAIISCGEWNRYGHPSQVVLDRLKAANVKVYRTDLHGEISITTRGRQSDYVVKTTKEATSDIWLGRTAQKDDSTRSGFIAYGDFGPPPKAKTGK